MAKAKCKICGTPLDTNVAYRVITKSGQKKYYCSEEEYEAEEARKQKVAADKDRVYYLICDIMGEKEIINTILFKEWAIWNRVADNEKIAKYLEENKDYLVSVIGKLSSSEFAKIRYLSTIIKDKIKGFVPKVEVEEKSRVVVEEYYETKYRSKGRQALEDFEEDDGDE